MPEYYTKESPRVYESHKLSFYIGKFFFETNVRSGTMVPLVRDQRSIFLFYKKVCYLPFYCYTCFQSNLEKSTLMRIYPVSPYTIQMMSP